MPNAETCPTCLRPRCTAEDLERWRREFGDKPAPEPPWAKAICWTKPEARCHSRPRPAP